MGESGTGIAARRAAMVALALAVAVPSAHAQDAAAPKGDKPVVQSPADDEIARAIRASERLMGDAKPLKSGRLVAPGADKNLPALQSPVDSPADAAVQVDQPASDIKPSDGPALRDRMGLPLPDLPKEKPYTGFVDEAYGAFQRGYYLEAMDKALARAQKGDAAAQTLVAELLASGLGVRRNIKDAVFWYEQAAKTGDANAQYKYALILMDEKIGPVDRKKADEMMRKAAAGGNKYAQFNIAQVMVAAKPGHDGLMEAYPWYEKSAEQGVPDAEYAMSQLLINLDFPREKRMQARMWLERAARSGFDTAQYDLGVWLVNGVGGDRDFNAGFKWLRIAALRGHVLAMNRLAHLYVNAIGTAQDPIEAAKWYVLSRRAGLKDLELEDFYLGIEDSQQKEAVARADAFRPG